MININMEMVCNPPNYVMDREKILHMYNTCTALTLNHPFVSADKKPIAFLLLHHAREA
jgi:hypothetical protein